jgi:serine/threonine protein kinase
MMLKVVRDRYELRRSFGSGGFGEVHLGFDRELEREVAIKRIFGVEDNEAFQLYTEHELKVHFADRMVV